MNNATYIIIDDNSIDRMISATFLKKCMKDPDIHMIEDSDSGIKWIKRNRPNYPKKLVILLDMQMPDIDGFGFLEAYARLDNSFKDRHEIIMLSSMDPKSLQIKKAQSHPLIKAILYKPLNIDELKEVI